MKLTESVISVCIDNCLPAEGRLSLSSGTVAIPTIQSGNRIFTVGAHVTRDDWRDVEESESNLLHRISDDSDFSNTIAIKKVPEAIHILSDKMGFNQVSSQTEMNALIAKHPESQLLSNMVSTYCKILAYPELNKFEFPRYFFLPPNQSTVSVDYSGHFIGLHIDNSVAFNAPEADNFPNRISLNLGRSKRYLLFINKTVREAIHMIRNVDPAFSPIGLDAPALVRLFCTMFPGYPVARVCIHPGEAYIAPTDNVMHDGSSLGGKDFDITIVSRGYLNPFADSAGIILAKEKTV